MPDKLWFSSSASKSLSSRQNPRLRKIRFSRYLFLFTFLPPYHFAIYFYSFFFRPVHIYATSFESELAAWRDCVGRELLVTIRSRSMVLCAVVLAFPEIRCFLPDAIWIMGVGSSWPSAQTCTVCCLVLLDEHSASCGSPVTFQKTTMRHSTFAIISSELMIIFYIYYNACMAI